MSLFYIKKWEEGAIAFQYKGLSSKNIREQPSLISLGIQPQIQHQLSYPVSTCNREAYVMDKNCVSFSIYSEFMLLLWFSRSYAKF